MLYDHKAFSARRGVVCKSHVRCITTKKGIYMNFCSFSDPYESDHILFMSSGVSML